MNPSPKIIAIAAVVGLAAVLALVLFVLRETPPDEATAPAASQAAGTDALAAADLDGDGIVYQSGMHPWIVQDAPGQCPVCGMDLTPVRVDGAGDGGVRIDPVTLQNMGVRTAPVEVAALGREVRTTGRFEADPERHAVVSARVGGWVEHLHVRFEGARVRRGQALMDVYSPELVATQEEYLLALRNRDRLAGTPGEADAQRLVDAARRRLAYWDVSAEQIGRLEASGVPSRTITIHAPASGTVTRLGVAQGVRVQPGETVMEIGGLDVLWLMADVYEQEMGWVGVGTTAVVELPHAPERRVRGEVAYVYDAVDAATRTGRARIEVPNPDGALRPGMFANVTLIGGEAQPTPVVPAEAVVRTGTRAVVIVDAGDGRFRAVEVQAGLESDGRVQILSGLEGGERVVTSAQFLIDSEARLRSVVGALGAPAGADPTPTAGELLDGEGGGTGSEGGR